MSLAHLGALLVGAGQRPGARPRDQIASKLVSNSATIAGSSTNVGSLSWNSSSGWKKLPYPVRRRSPSTAKASTCIK
jgi:hypothetical protein